MDYEDPPLALATGRRKGDPLKHLPSAEWRRGRQRLRGDEEGSLQALPRKCFFFFKQHLAELQESRAAVLRDALFGETVGLVDGVRVRARVRVKP